MAVSQAKLSLLSNKDDIDRMLNKFEISVLRRIYNYIIFKIIGCKKLANDKRYFSGQRIKMERAAEPTDIFWENFSVVTIQRVKYSVFTYFITGLLLGISFTINLFSAIIQTDLEESSRKNPNQTQKYLYSLLIVVANAIIVSVINFILGKLIRLLSSYEVHETYTNYNLSVAIKLTFTRFINTGIIPFAVHVRSENWFTTSGLTTDILVIILATAFLSPLIDLFEPVWILNKFIIWKEKRKGEKCKLTQAQLNKLYEVTPFDLAQCYCDTYLLLMISLFYVTLLPIVSLVCIFGIIYQYWIDKYLLLRRSQTPEHIGKQVANGFSFLMPFSILVFACGQFLFISSLSEGQNKYSQIILYCALLFLIFPIKKCCFFLENYGEFANRKYHLYQDYFDSSMTEYEKHNPVTFEPPDGQRDDSKSEVSNQEGSALINSFNNQRRITSRNINYAHLLHYAKQATLNDRVIDDYQNFKYINVESSSDKSYKHTALYRRVLNKLTNLNLRAIENLNQSQNYIDDEESKEWRSNTFKNLRKNVTFKKKRTSRKGLPEIDQTYFKDFQKQCRISKYQIEDIQELDEEKENFESNQKVEKEQGSFNSIIEGSSHSIKSSYKDSQMNSIEKKLSLPYSQQTSNDPPLINLRKNTNKIHPLNLSKFEESKIEDSKIEDDNFHLYRFPEPEK